jgi:hypothetical protein
MGIQHALALPALRWEGVARPVHNPGDGAIPRGTAPSGDSGRQVVQVVLPPRGVTSLPGRHVTDHQMRLYMKFRQTDTPPAAAAKASFSTSTAYRLEKNPRLPRRRKPRADDVVPLADRSGSARDRRRWTTGASLYRAEDAVAEAYAMVFLVEAGSPSKRTWRGRSSGRRALFGATKSTMAMAGWRRSVERKGGVAADDVSPGNACGASRC